MRETEIEVFKACVSEPATIRSWDKIIREADPKEQLP